MGPVAFSTRSIKRWPTGCGIKIVSKVLFPLPHSVIFIFCAPKSAGDMVKVVILVTEGSIEALTF